MVRRQRELREQLRRHEQHQLDIEMQLRSIGVTPAAPVRGGRRMGGRGGAGEDKGRPGVGVRQIGAIGTHWPWICWWVGG